jgi:hypothetical protein
VTAARDDQFRAAYRKLRLTHQQLYYKERSDEYRSAHRQAILVRNALLVTAALAGVGAQFTYGTARAGCGVIAALLAALAGAVTGFDALIGFALLQKLYYDAALNLEGSTILWDQHSAGKAVSAEEIAGVEMIMRVEVGQWGQLLIKDAVEQAGDGAAKS